MNIDKKIIKQAVKEGNLLQFVEYEIMKYASAKTKDRDVMKVAEKIIERVKAKS